jgi:RibD C-terminal domain
VADATSRTIIAALQVSLDGLIEGPNGEVDWIGSWEDSFDLLPEIDTLVLGGRAYPGYEQYWLAILANPEGVLPLTGTVPSKGEVEYARFADQTPHVVLSRTLDEVAWKTTRIVRDMEDIRALKQQPGKAIHGVVRRQGQPDLQRGEIRSHRRVTRRGACKGGSTCGRR